MCFIHRAFEAIVDWAFGTQLKVIESMVLWILLIDQNLHRSEIRSGAGVSSIDVELRSPAQLERFRREGEASGDRRRYAFIAALMANVFKSGNFVCK